MVRVYLDWNIVSYLFNFKSNKQPYIELNHVLTSNKERILIPYSSAHLTDLITGYKSSQKAKDITHKNLEYLKELTSERCLVFDKSKKHTYPDIYSIDEYFSQLLESSEISDNMDLESIFAPLSDFVPPGSINQIFDILKSIPTNFTNAELGTDQIDNPYFKGITESGSVYELLQNSLKTIGGYSSDPTLYRTARNGALDLLNMSYDYTNSPDPIAEISKRLELTAFKKNFTEFAESTLQNYFGDKQPDIFDIFTNYYMTLDFLGFYRDRQFKNLIQDCFHAFYGAHCDFFVTDDINTYNKAKVIYDYFNIGTIVCRSHEFLNAFYSKILITKGTSQGLISTIKEVIKTAFILPNKVDNNLNPVDIFKVEHFILDYFNRLQITHYQDGRKILNLYKKNETYSSFYFFEEIEVLTNKLMQEFGADINGKANYNLALDSIDTDPTEWSGRTWEIDNMQIHFHWESYPFGLTLTMNL